MNKLTKQEKEWLVDLFPLSMGRVLRGNIKQDYLKAEFLLLGTQTLPDCDCQNEGYKRKIERSYREWIKKP